MRTYLIVFLLLTLSTVMAHTEHVPADYQQPTAQEIKSNRACFEEVAQNGCGDPGEDIQQFRSCLHNVFPTLSPSCQKMMSRLYSR